MKSAFSNRYHLLFIIWSVACMVILPFMSKDAGITEDEPIHLEHGKTILAWYEGKDKTAVADAFDDKGQWKVVTEGNGSKSAMNIYGGLFDTLSAFIYQSVTHHFWGEYESKHIMSAIFGALLIIFTGLICQRVSNSWAIALLGIAIATFTPRIIGNSLSNPKDIPQATMFAFSLLQIISFLKELPELKLKRLLLVWLSLGLALAIRSGAVILIFYFIAFSTVYVISLALLGDLKVKRAGIITAAVFATGILGYLGCSLFWPWAMMNPIMNPLRSLVVFKNFAIFDCYEIFEGRWLHMNELPWYFVPKWLYITLPVTVVGGFILFFILIQKFIQRGGLNLVIYSLLVFSVLFPLLSIIISHSNIYNSARHVLFIIPSIVVIATLGWAELFNQLKSSQQKNAVSFAFLLLLAEPALYILNNNPYQAMYFSPLIGGEKGAFKNYEMDYWGYSIRPAVDWLDNTDSIHIAGRKTRIRMYYGEQIKLSYYTAKSKNLSHVLCQENSTDWDYQIILPAEAKHEPDLLYHWPPAGTIYEVKTEGVPLCAITKNPRITEATNNQPAVSVVQTNDSSTYFLAAGINLYQAGDYNHAAMMFKQSISHNPGNKIAINDLVATYNQLKMFDDAIAMATEGLKLDPTFQLLLNNLAESKKARASFKPDEAYYDNLSYNYYVQGDFVKVIESAKNALKLNPNSVVAWNNICSAYNSLHQYKKAEEACSNGLKIDANNVMLKNNKAEATKLLGK